MIEIGSARFELLTTPFLPGTRPPFVYDQAANELILNWTSTALTITVIQYEDRDPEFRDIVITVASDEQRLAIIRLLLALLQNTPQATIGQLLAAVRAALLETSAEPFLTQHMTGFAFEGVVFNLEGVMTPAQNVVPPLFLAQPLGEDMALRLPFSNLDWNEGTEAQCVDRFLHIDLTAQPELRNVDGMVQLAELHGFDLTVFDILSGVMAEYTASPVTDLGFDKTVFRCMVFNKHVYPLTKGDRPRLFAFPIKRYDGAPAVYDLIEEKGAALFMINNAFYVAGAGLLVPESKHREEWMSPFLDLLPDGQGWDPDAMLLVKKSCLALQYHDSSVEAGLDPSDHVAYDISKCYYHAMKRAMKPGDHPFIGRPSIFNRFKPCRNDEEVFNSHYYKAEVDPRWLARLGLLTDVMLGGTVMLLRHYGIAVKITHVLRFDTFSVITPKAREKAYEMMCAWSPEQQKKYAIINGIMGRTNSMARMQFQIDDPMERNYYVERYNAMEWGNIICLERKTYNTINQLHWHAHVVHTASQMVLAKAFEVYKEYGVWPVKIKVDSLTYRIRDLRTPFDVTARGRLTHFFEGSDTVFPWHREAVTNPDTYVAPPLFRYLDVPTTPPYDNVTYIGPPGVGKTYSALNNHAIDLAVCFSNKGARRIGGRTVHSALMLWGSGKSPRLDDLRGKTIFFDEFQAAGRTLIAHCMRAYHEVGTRFIIAMDPNQLAPVGELPINPSDCPFMGEIRALTTEHRNDAELVRHRREILARTFRPRLQPWPIDWSNFDMCIAYTRNTCAVVNHEIVKARGLKFGDQEGRYIATAASKRHNVLKSELLRRRGNNWLRSDGSVLTLKLTAARKFIDWGFCVTIHKMLGETVEGSLAIFDWDHPLFDARLRYTALTRARRYRDISFYGTTTINFGEEEYLRKLTEIAKEAQRRSNQPSPLQPPCPPPS